MVHYLVLSPGKKRGVLSICFLYAFLVGLNGASYTDARLGVTRDIPVGVYVYLLGITVTLTAVAFAPMALAPLSEVLGRRPVYTASVWLYVATFIPQALAKNITTILVTRCFHGIAVCLPLLMSLAAPSLAVHQVFPCDKSGLVSLRTELGRTAAAAHLPPFLPQLLLPLALGHLQLASLTINDLVLSCWQTADAVLRWEQYGRRERIGFV